MSNVLTQSLVNWLMTPRDKDAHKGLYGHVLIVGGGQGMPGAVYLAANAALRVGAGRESIATCPEYAKQSLPGLPEVMVHGVASKQCLLPLLATATVCVLGPGLGVDEWAKQLFSEVITVAEPLVIDASALRLLASMQYQDSTHHTQWVLTPHLGEAAGLLDCDVHEIHSSRLICAKRIQQSYGGTVVLKGPGTIVVDTKGHSSTCNAGNPGMATAGMGDVLSGVIGGLIAQGLSPTDAARLGVWLHATAGDKASNEHGERGLVASDLMPFLHQLSNPVKPPSCS